jgi:hypothetical protein
MNAKSQRRFDFLSEIVGLTMTVQGVPSAFSLMRFLCNRFTVDETATNWVAPCEIIARRHGRMTSFLFCESYTRKMTHMPAAELEQRSLIKYSQKNQWNNAQFVRSFYKCMVLMPMISNRENVNTSNKTRSVRPNGQTQERKTNSG